MGKSLEQSRESLEIECRVFTKCLTGVEANTYIQDKYKEAHLFLSGLTSCDDFDNLLVSIARRSRISCRVADAYARWFAPQSVLRCKLVTLLAILECTSPYSTEFDETPSAFLPLLVAGWGIAILGNVVALSIGVLLLHPTRVWLRMSRRRI